MPVRALTLFISMVALGSFVACGPRGSTGGGGSGGSAGGSSAGGGSAAGGGTGGGSAAGGGTGGGSAAGGGTGGGSTFVYDGGTTISAARGAPFCSEKVTIDNVVITSVSNAFAGSLGDYSAQFWVADPNNLKDALYVDKFFTDPSVPPKFEPKAGMIVKLQGYMFRQGKFVDRVANRLTIKSQFNCRKPDNTFYNPADPITVTLIDAGTGVAPTPLTAPAGFGDAMMGNGRPNPDYGSVRVTIPGPLSITAVSPPAFKRISQVATDTTYFGFEVTGGILVNNFNTFDLRHSDGGTTVRCDWRKMMLDGGSVRFPNGITGVWDTYSHASCEDGGTDCSGTNDRRNAATVPGANPANDYTYALYPVDCSELAGQYDAGL